MRSSAMRWFLAVLVVVWALFPMYWLLKNAFDTPAGIATFPPRFAPSEWHLSAFYNVLNHRYVTKTGEILLPAGEARQVVSGIWNSLKLAVAVSLITTAVVVPLAYVFARLEFRRKTLLLIAVLLSVALPPISTLVPFYSLFLRLGLTGTLTGLTIVTLTITIPLVTWMTIGFLGNLPRVEPLARLDGFSRVETFLKVVVPMAKGGIAVGALISFLFAWNEYTFALILVNGTPATTLPAAITGFMFIHPQPGHLAAAIFYSLVPPFALAYVLQRHITELNLVDPIR